MRAMMMAVAALALASCGRAGGYPAEYGANFIASCERTGAPAAQCQCVWDKIETEVPVADFESLDRAVSAGQDHPLKARFAEFAAQCDAPE